VDGATPSQYSHVAPMYCYPDSVPVTSSAVIPRELRCLQPRLLSFTHRGFRIGAYGAGALFSRPTWSRDEGDTNLTHRSRKNILGAATIGVLLFAGSSSARTTDQPRVASADRPGEPIAVGMIEIPAVGLATRVLEGSDARILGLSVGHIAGTALPGPSGNIGLAGHRDTYFRSLRRIKVGDTIRLTTVAGTFKYRVVSLRVVLPSAIEVLNDTQQPTLTLVTCYPFDFIGAAPQRLIVHAEMVPDSLD
jgi:sortase A